MKLKLVVIVGVGALGVPVPVPVPIAVWKLLVDASRLIRIMLPQMDTRFLDITVKKFPTTSRPSPLFPFAGARVMYVVFGLQIRCFSASRISPENRIYISGLNAKFI